jgi:hypothetical protein
MATGKGKDLGALDPDVANVRMVRVLLDAESAGKINPFTGALQKARGTLYMPSEIRPLTKAIASLRATKTRK